MKKFLILSLATLSLFACATKKPEQAPKDLNSRVFVEGGTFEMGYPYGSLHERPVHKVTVKSFYISKYEVTNAQYAKFLNAKGNQFEGNCTWLDIDYTHCEIEEKDGVFIVRKGRENRPVSSVTYFGAKAYCEWVGGRLPTEAEWEYAAIGGKKSKGYRYSGSNTLWDVAWCSENDFGVNHPVGTKQANELGIHDMSGNVVEWCQDLWHSDYKGAPTDGSAWMSDWSSRNCVLRYGVPVYSRSYTDPGEHVSCYFGGEGGVRVIWDAK